MKDIINIKDIIKIIICGLCYGGIFALSNIDFASKEYWMIVVMLFIQGIVWGI